MLSHQETGSSHPLPIGGDSPKPEESLTFEIMKIAIDDPAPERSAFAVQIEAPGADSSTEVRDFRRCYSVCRCYVYNRYTGYIYYWYYCCC